MSEKAMPLEKLFEEIEEITRALEGGELPMEEAIAAFERGMALSREAAKILEAAEQKLVQVLGEGEGEQALTLESDG